jgi:hypothetical protein
MLLKNAFGILIWIKIRFVYTFIFPPNLGEVGVNLRNKGYNRIVNRREDEAAIDQRRKCMEFETLPR